MYTSGVSIDYPTGWMVKDLKDVFVAFLPAPGDKAFPGFGVTLEVYHRPVQYSAITNPHTWEGNEGGYLVHWQKSIAIKDAQGLEFIWGALRDQGWDSPVELYAIYYSAQHELDVRVATGIDSYSLELAQTRGLTDTITSRFAYFDHMMQSVRIGQQ